MLDELRGLYAHMAWADAVHWHVIAQHEVAQEDEAIRERVHHIVTVQRAFHSPDARAPRGLTIAGGGG